MFIQCSSCGAKYRLNLEKIPNRKTFIKCRQCTAPIYIDPQEDAAAGESLPAGPAPEVDREDGVRIVCDECGAQYQVAAESLKRIGLKLKCSACGHKFSVPDRHGALAPPRDEQETRGDGEGFAPMGGEEAGREEQPMPVPGAGRMDTMFDDLRVDAPPGGSAPQDFTPADGLNMYGGPAPSNAEGGGANSDEAFLEAVSFGEPGGSAAGRPEGGKISDDQKYRFFMKPTDPSNPDRENEEAGQGEETEALPHPDDLPTLDDLPSAASAASPEAETPAAKPPPENAAPDRNLSPALVQPHTTVHGINPVVEGQPIPKSFESRVFWSMVAALVAVAVAGGAWGYRIFTQPAATDVFAVIPGQVADLTPTAKRKGYFITNKPTGERLYILTGEVVNRFATEDGVRWVRLEGIAYDRTNRPLQKGLSYAGNLLRDNQLANWNLEAIRAYYGYLNGREDVNFRIPQGKTVPYQVVLFGVKGPVAAARTQVASFNRRGKGVFLKTFP